MSEESTDIIDHRNGAKDTPPVIDESGDFDLGILDLIFGLISFPILVFIVMFSFTGAENILASKRARLKLYGVLIAVEIAIIAIAWWFLVR